MSDLKRFFGSRDDVPEWASFFDAREFRAFLEAFEDEIRKRGWTCEIDDGVARVRRNEGEPAVCGLQNLAQKCHHSDQAEWTGIISGHLQVLDRAQTDPLAGFEDDFEKARAIVKVRLQPDDYPKQLPPGALIYRAVAPGMIATLVYDLPQSVVSLHSDHPKKWGISEDVLFDLGIKNVKAEGTLPAQITELEGGETIVALMGDSFFSATHALFLEDYVSPPGRFGLLVAIPNRHAVLYHSIENLGVARAINAMIPAAFGMFREGPGSVSPHLYWWRAGQFRHLPARVTAKTIEFSPPDDFVEEILNRLPEA